MVHCRLHEDQTNTQITQQSQAIPAPPQKFARSKSRAIDAKASALPPTHLEQLAAAFSRNVLSALGAASQQLQSWSFSAPQTPSTQTAALLEGSASSSPDEAVHEACVFASSLPPRQSHTDASLQQRQQQQHDANLQAQPWWRLQRHALARPQQDPACASSPAAGWFQKRWHRLGSRCSNALHMVEARGIRQLDCIRTSVQQTVPWPHVHVQRRSALRIRVHSCHMQWPSSFCQPCLEVNLTNL